MIRCKRDANLLESSSSSSGPLDIAESQNLCIMEEVASEPVAALFPT
jgi:hypothetical protein